MNNQYEQGRYQLEDGRDITAFRQGVEELVGVLIGYLGGPLYPETPEEQGKRWASCVVMHEAVPVRYTRMTGGGKEYFFSPLEKKPGRTMSMRTYKYRLYANKANADKLVTPDEFARYHRSIVNDLPIEWGYESSLIFEKPF